MNQMEYINNSQEKNFKNKETTNIEILNNHIQLEKDVCILINYVRTNPLDFCDNLVSKNKYKKLSKEQFELINFLKEVYNKGVLFPFQEIPEISKAAKSLLNSLALNINKNQDLNLRKRLSLYGHRSGRIFETVVFKTDRAEDIVNYILLEEKGRNMLLSNKMKYIGISCGFLPQKMMCTVIDIVQDFIPFERKNKEDTNSNNINNMNENYDKGPCHKKYNSQNLQNLNELNYENNINNLKLKLENRENQISYSNTHNMNIIINNNHNNINNKNDIKNIFDNKNNNDYIPNLFLNKYSNQRKKNIYSKLNEYNKASSKKKLSLEEKENYFSPNSINSYNIIINNKISPKRNNLNNIFIIKKDFNNNNNFSYNINQKKENEIRNNNYIYKGIERKEVEKENNDMFTMAGRTCKEQKEVLEISTKMNLIKSKSLCSFDLNSNNFKNNKLQRLNFQEKIDILHKINQRNSKPKSLSSNKISNDNITDKTPFTTKNYNEISSIKYNSNLKRAKIGENEKKISFNTSKHLSSGKEKSNFINYECTTPIRFNTYIYKMNEINKNNFNANGRTPLYPSYMETKSNQGNEICDINEEYSVNTINEIKNDLILFKNKIKKELKDEVKKEIKEEIKNEITIKQRPDSNQKEQDYKVNNNSLNDLISNNNNNYQSKDENNNDNENKVKIIDDEIYFKKNNGDYLAKNKMKNRCFSEEKYFYIKKNINNNAKFLTNNNTNEITNSKERKKYVSNIKDKILRDKYKETYEQLNYMTKATVDKIKGNSLQNINNNNDISYEIKNKSFFNDTNRIKKKQEIKKLIKLYNIAKDSKRNINRSNIESIYDIISYNKSIPNYFSRKNYYNIIKKNSLERNKIDEECSNAFFDDEEYYNKIQKSIFLNNNQLIKEENDKKDENNDEKSNCNQTKISKIKSQEKLSEFMKDNNNKLFSVETMNKNKGAENLENELKTIYDKNIKENITSKEGDSFLTTKNEILSITGRFIEGNSESNIIDNKDSGIKSYKEKNFNSYKKGKSNKDNTIKNKNKIIYIPSHHSKEKIGIKENYEHKNKNQNQEDFKMCNSKTMTNINYVKNNNIIKSKYEKKIRGCFRGEKKGEKYKTPNHNQKQEIFEENCNDKNNKFINLSNIIIKKKTSYYKPKKYMSYQYFLSNNQKLEKKE